MGNKKLYLQVRTPIVKNEKLLWEWKTLAAANDIKELERMIPKGRKRDCKISSKQKGIQSICCKEQKSDSYQAQKLRFSKQLIAIMQEKRILRKDLPAICGLSRANVWSYLSAKTYPREETIQKICEGLGVTREELLGKES